VATSRTTFRTDQHGRLPVDSHTWPLHDDRCSTLIDGVVDGGCGEGSGDPAGASDVAGLRQEIEDLRLKLATQPTIEQAKGVLIGFYGIDAATAFAVLVRWSQHSNTKLRVLAAELVAAATGSPGQPSPALHDFIHQLPTGGPPLRSS
jgi:hypothetical protein